MAVLIIGITTDQNYLIGNPIWARVLNPAPPSTILYLTVQVNGMDYEFKYYPTEANDFYVNISPIIKHLMPDPAHSTEIIYSGSTSFLRKTLTFTMYYEGDGPDALQRTLNFIRGFKRTNISNIEIGRETWLVNADLIPIWPGFQVYGYKIPAALNKIERYSSIPTEASETMRVKGCNNTYVKFLNSLGGYSFWLFEKNENTDENEHLGYAEHRDRINDFGSYAEHEIKVESKVPRRYMGLMRDLIVSPEVYIYDPDPEVLGDTWKRRVMDDSDIDENSWDEAYRVSLTLVDPVKYNPSVIW